MFYVPSQPGENRSERLGEFESSPVKSRDAVEGFYLLENSYKLCRGFHQAMEARTTCFIFFIKLIFSMLTKRRTIYEARIVNSHNSETVKPHCSRHFCASQRCENKLVYQSKRLYYSNYFINKVENFIIEQKNCNQKKCVTTESHLIQLYHCSSNQLKRLRNIEPVLSRSLFQKIFVV